MNFISAGHKTGCFFIFKVAFVTKSKLEYAGYNSKYTYYKQQ